jgi:hypothetical protein
MTIDAKDLVSITTLADPVGVLSVYITADPREGAGARPGWQVRIANDLASLDRRLRKDGDVARADLLMLRLADVHRELREMVSASTPGQSRALFVALETGTMTTVELPVPVRDDHVQLGRSAHVRPLLAAAMNSHPPAGVVAVSGHGVHLVDIRFGHAADAGTERFDPDAFPGPAAANPAVARHNAAPHDQYARHETDRLARFLRGAAGRVAERAAELGWEYLVLTGDPERTAAFAAGLPHEPALPTVTVEHRIAGLSAAKIYAMVAGDLEDLRHQGARAVARRARDLALGGGPGAYGLADTLTALSEGAVLNLVLDASGEWAGRVGPDGRLYPELVSVPGVADEALAVEPRLGERMVEAALRQGGRVTLLDPADAVDLRDAGGVAAVLRW